MSRIRHRHFARRVAALLAGLTGVLLGAAVTPAAFAMHLPPGGQSGPVPPAAAPVRTVVVGGMPGWQIVLIAAGAGLAAAVAAVLLDRTRAARRHLPAVSA
jgi:hypothetical protein